MQMTKKRFGSLNGQPVYWLSLTNKYNVTLSAMTYGAAVTELIIPNQEGRLDNVVLGFPDFEPYVTNPAYFGATVGRVAGRVANASFELDGRLWQLDKNNGAHHLHGGSSGFSRRVWDAAVRKRGSQAALIFTLRSPDGENGYPGNLDAQVTYTLTEDSRFTIQYEAITDRPTLFNPTNHTYFNLTGDPEQTILDHTLRLSSSRFAELDQDSLPTGELADVSGTPFDLREGRKLADGYRSSHPQNQQVGHGYDHPFVLAHDPERPDAVLHDPVSGRTLSMRTDADSVIVYTANALPKNLNMGGKKTGNYAGVTLETQALPDAVHHEGFGNIVLRPGERFQSKTEFTFS